MGEAMKEQATVKPSVQLSGEDGNAFMIIGACRRSARRAGWSNARIEKVCEDMMSGDYDHVLQTAMKHFEVR
jgi:hypothetical protein